MLHHEPESQINRGVVQKMRRKAFCPERAYAPCKPEDLTILTREFVRGTGITEIALMLRRTEMEVVRLIEGLELYGRLDCRPAKKSESPLCAGCPWKSNCSGPSEWYRHWNIRQEDR